MCNKSETAITATEMKMIRRIAKDVYRVYCPAGVSGQLALEDLYHYGIVGFLEAMRNFKPSIGVTRMGFAMLRVRGAMIDQIRRQPIIRLPQARQHRVSEVKAARETLLRKGETPTVENLAGHLNCGMDEVSEALAMIPVMQRTDTVSDGWSDEDDFRELVLTDETGSQEDMVFRNEITQVITRCLENLPTDKDRLILTGRLIENLKLRELANVLNCSIENVRQWQNRVQAMMKACIESHGLTVD